MTVRGGQIVTLKPEFLDPGETNISHVALEKSFDGSVRVEPVDAPGLLFKPITDWRIGLDRRVIAAAVALAIRRNCGANV